jgi:hypothetical protein
MQSEGFSWFSGLSFFLSILDSHLYHFFFLPCWLVLVLLSRSFPPQQLVRQAARRGVALRREGDALDDVPETASGDEVDGALFTAFLNETDYQLEEESVMAGGCVNIYLSAFVLYCFFFYEYFAALLPLNVPLSFIAGLTPYIYIFSLAASFSFPR